ncbi:MAG: hypothetical protein ACRYGM_05230 [Janthinobacterium lividum]
MTNAKTVRDRTGATVTRVDGVLLDGDQLIMPGKFMDAAGVDAVQPATLAVARRLFGDSSAADYSGMTDAAARVAIVQKRIGDPAKGQSTAYLDAAWGAMAGTVKPVAGPGALVLTDAQRAVSKAGIDAAMNRVSKPIADREALAGHRAAMEVRLSDRWKSPEARAVADDGLTYEQRVVKRSGGYSSFTQDNAK